MTSVAETVKRALEQQRSGNLHQAEQHYRQALQTEPASAQAWRRLGTLCQSLGRLE
jgi:Flp pilus assembly protein TadD